MTNSGEDVNGKQGHGHRKTVTHTRISTILCEAVLYLFMRPRRAEEEVCNF